MVGGACQTDQELAETIRAGLTERYDAEMRELAERQDATILELTEHHSSKISELMERYDADFCRLTEPCERALQGTPSDLGASQGHPGTVV
eukprot:5014800-Alexandrium_andersonii.AAC.1